MLAGLYSYYDFLLCFGSFIEIKSLKEEGLQREYLRRWNEIPYNFPIYKVIVRISSMISCHTSSLKKLVEMSKYNSVLPRIDLLIFFSTRSLNLTYCR